MPEIHSSPYIKLNENISRMMLAVIFALIPGILVYIKYFGWGVVMNISFAVITAVFCEVLILKLRKRPVKPFITDGTAVLTAILLALALPTLAPWWLPAVGAGFAIIIAKHLYGGLGYNPFNPAMVGYAMLLIAFPKEMTAWIPPETHGMGILDTLRYALFETLPDGKSFDALTMATPLDTIKTQLNLNFTLDEIRNTHQSLFGSIAGYGWEWINIMFLVGGLLLVFIKVITWHIPVAVLGSLAIMAAIFNFADSGSFSPVSFHLFGGAAMLGAFFIATDPVTAAASNKGRLIYGAGIGILIYVIRTWGGYPDAIAFSVLLMNMAVPMIDYYTKPPVFGAVGKN
jgi:electron transport complex protein RnfD